MQRRDFMKKTALATAAFGIPTLVPASVLGKNAPSNKIQIAQIGCGRIARDHDLPGVWKHDVARIVAVSDLDSKRMAEGKQFIEDHYTQKMGSPYLDVKQVADYRDLFKRKDIDAVIISTPDHWHSQPAMEAALAGKHVYLQKPTSLTIKEGRQLVEVIQRTGVVLQLGTQQRSSEQFRLAAELVRNGRIGKLHTVRIGLPGDPSGPEAPAMPVPANLNFDMWLGSTPEVPYTEIGVHPQNDYGRPGWLRHENYGAGMITGWGQHHFDSAAWGMNTEFMGPRNIEAVAEFPRSGLWNVHGDFFLGPILMAFDTKARRDGYGFQEAAMWLPLQIQWLKGTMPKLWMLLIPNFCKPFLERMNCDLPVVLRIMATGWMLSKEKQSCYRQ